ncbi:MAG: HEAT repeat domain-containing protein [Verrucomicrobiota bacterium]
MLWWTYQQLRSSSMKTRLAAVAKLAESKHADSVEPLLFALKDSMAEIRSAAALALGPFQDTRSVEPLVKLLRDPVPLVRATGGLIDTVVDTTPDTTRAGTASGFVFEAYDSQALERAVSRALDAHADRELWNGLVRRAMLPAWSCDASGRAYMAVYGRLCEKP